MDHEVNVVLVGTAGSGKTAILKRFIEGIFDASFYAPIGIDFQISTFQLDDGRKIKAKFFDTPGPERFRTITTPYLRCADGVFIVYDVSNRSSLENAKGWYKDVQHSAKESAIVALVGNKADDGDKLKRQVLTEEGEKLAEKHNSYFVEISALHDIGIKKSFRRMVELIVEAKDAEQSRLQDLRNVNAYQDRGDGAGGDGLEPVTPIGFSQTFAFMRQRFQTMLSLNNGSGLNVNPVEEPQAQASGTISNTSTYRNLWLVPELEVRSLAERARRKSEMDSLIKMVVVGDSGVGKTALIRRLIEQKYLDFHERECATIGVEFYVKQMILEDDRKFKLQIWDTPGAQRFWSTVPAYLTGADIVLITYDVCNISSFANLGAWQQQITRTAPTSKYALVGHQCEKDNHLRQVTKAQGEALAKNWKCLFFEVSAKQDINVTECFYETAKEVVEERHLRDVRYGDGAG